MRLNNDMKRLLKCLPCAYIENIIRKVWYRSNQNSDLKL